MVRLLELSLLPSALQMVRAISTANISKTITADIAVVGGGGSGANAAVLLNQDHHKNVIVIEKRAQLGGHVNSYVDPETKVPYDYGVLSYIDYGNSREFFARFNITLANQTRIPLTNQYADFRTGAAITNYVAPSGSTFGDALTTFLNLTEQFEPLILPGYWDFPQPDQIPEDLLLPFRDFVAKHSLEPIVPLIFEITGCGIGNIMDKITLGVIQTFGAPMTRTLLGLEADYAPASNRNQDLYDAIGKWLGDDVLYSSVVVEAERNATGVRLVVENKITEERTLIEAGQLLIAIEPTTHNLDPFDLDQQERDIFDKWSYSRLYAGIVNHPSLPVNVSIINTPAAMAPANYTNLPTTPFLARFDYAGPGLFEVLITGDETLTPEGAKGVAEDALRNLIQRKTLAAAVPEAELEWVAFNAHGPMQANAPAEEYRQGFIQKQYALQGHRSTWYTGAAFSAHYQTTLWAYNEVLIPKMLAG